MQATLTIAIEAAREAGKIIFRNMSRVHSLNIKAKEKNDFVSEVDLQAEQEIINVIHDEYQWIIDPLDGTTNFLHGFPHYSVSIALKHKERLEVAVIYDPFKDELFCAGRGNGASLNDRKIRVSKLPSLEGSLLATGFPYKENQNIDTYLSSLKDIMLQTSGIRRAGSAALDLAYVGAGRVDGFWEFGLNTWDIAAGCLIVQEAGGLVGDTEGGHSYLESGNVVAANTKIFRQILQSLNR